MIRDVCRIVVFAVTLASVAAIAEAAPILSPAEFDASATVITFEGSLSLPVVPGVTFVNTSPPDSPWFMGSVGTTVSFFGTNGMANLVSTTYSDLAIVFASPVDAVGAWVGNVPDFRNSTVASVTVRALDSSSNVLETAVVPLSPANGTPTFFGFSSATGISRIEWLGGNSGFFAVDNVTFGDVAVAPEPASMLLFGTALLGAGVRRWRQKRT